MCLRRLPRWEGGSRRLPTPRPPSRASSLGSVGEVLSAPWLKEWSLFPLVVWMRIVVLLRVIVGNDRIVYLHPPATEPPAPTLTSSLPSSPPSRLSLYFLYALFRLKYNRTTIIRIFSPSFTPFPSPCVDLSWLMYWSCHPAPHLCGSQV